MRHAVVMPCHRDLALVERHVEFLDGDFTFYIHIDRGWRISDIELAAFRERHPNVRTFRRYRVRWGGIGILRAELFLLRRVMEDGGADFVHVCSGQDYPVRSLAGIKAFFERNPGRQFMECHPLPYREWEGGTMRRLDRFHPFDLVDIHTPAGRTVGRVMERLQQLTGMRRSLPSGYALYGGSNWMSLSGDCARYIAEGGGITRPLLRRLRLTFASDEVFFQTAVMNSPFADSVVPDNMRLIVWRSGSGSPEILTEDDWWRIKTRDALWGRKFSRPESDSLLRLLLTRYGVGEAHDPDIPEELVARDPATGGRDVLVFTAYSLGDAVVERFMRVADAFRPFGDAFLVLCGGMPDNAEKACGRLGIRLLNVDEEDLNGLGYSPVEENLIPASEHFVLMWFFRKLPHYRGYWNVGHDVDLPGDRGDFFRANTRGDADFMSSRIRTVCEEPEWPWWDSFRSLTEHIPEETLIRSSNRVYRISRKAMHALDSYLGKGNEGHHEVLIPTFLRRSGFTVAELESKNSTDTWTDLR